MLSYSVGEPTTVPRKPKPPSSSHDENNRTTMPKAKLTASVKNLAEFPPEVILMIAARLPPSTTVILNLKLISRKLYNIFTQYEAKVLKDMMTERFPLFQAIRDPRKAYSLLELLFVQYQLEEIEELLEVVAGTLTAAALSHLRRDWRKLVATGLTILEYLEISVGFGGFCHLAVMPILMSIPKEVHSILCFTTINLHRAMFKTFDLVGCVEDYLDHSDLANNFLVAIPVGNIQSNALSPGHGVQEILALLSLLMTGNTKVPDSVFRLKTDRRTHVLDPSGTKLMFLAEAYAGRATPTLLKAQNDIFRIPDDSLFSIDLINTCLVHEYGGFLDDNNDVPSPSTEDSGDGDAPQDEDETQTENDQEPDKRATESLHDAIYPKDTEGGIIPAFKLTEMVDLLKTTRQGVDLMMAKLRTINPNDPMTWLLTKAGRALTITPGEDMTLRFLGTK